MIRQNCNIKEVRNDKAQYSRVGRTRPIDYTVKRDSDLYITSSLRNDLKELQQERNI